MARPGEAREVNTQRSKLMRPAGSSAQTAAIAVVSRLSQANVRCRLPYACRSAEYGGDKARLERYMRLWRWTRYGKSNSRAR